MLGKAGLILLLGVCFLDARQKKEEITEMKIACVDMKKLVETFAEDHEALARLQRTRARASDEMIQKKNKIKLLEKKIRDNESAGNFENANLYYEAESFKEELYAYVRTKNKELKGQEEETASEILRLIYREVKKIAEKGKIYIVADRSAEGVMYMDDEIDLTSRLMKVIAKEKQNQRAR